MPIELPLRQDCCLICICHSLLDLIVLCFVLVYELWVLTSLPKFTVGEGFAVSLLSVVLFFSSSLLSFGVDTLVLLGT